MFGRAEAGTGSQGTANLAKAPYILLTNFAGSADNQGGGARHHGAMKTISLITFGVLVAVLSNIVSLPAQDQSNDWVEQAISSNQSVAQKAQDQLREVGPQGLQMLAGLHIPEHDGSIIAATGQLRPIRTAPD